VRGRSANTLARAVVVDRLIAQAGESYSDVTIRVARGMTERGISEWLIPDFLNPALSTVHCQQDRRRERDYWLYVLVWRPIIPYRPSGVLDRA
jgi:hypothetical protein